MNYSWKKNDYNTGTQLNVSNFESLYPLLYFDLSYQAEQVSRDPKQLVLRYRIDLYHTMLKQKILPVQPLIQCEAGRAKTKLFVPLGLKMAAA